MMIIDKGLGKLTPTINYYKLNEMLVIFYVILQQRGLA